MTVPYDVFTAAFLAKVTEYDFYRMDETLRTEVVDGYMKRACAQFSEVCHCGIDKGDDVARTFELKEKENDITTGHLDELVDVISLGMAVQWFTQQFFNQENLRNMMSTKDYSFYSPAELLYRMTNAYEVCKSDYTNAVREYSYRHGDLTDLHL